jgi:hypothetical protein
MSELDIQQLPRSPTQGSSVRVASKGVPLPMVHHRLLGSLILKFTHDHISVGNSLSSRHIARSILVE